MARRARPFYAKIETHDRVRCFNAKTQQLFNLVEQGSMEGTLSLARDWHRFELDRTAITLIERPTRVSLAYPENRGPPVLQLFTNTSSFPRRLNVDENTFLKTSTNNISKSCYFLDQASQYNQKTSSILEVLLFFF